MSVIRKLLAASGLAIALGLAMPASAQTLLPNAQQQFVDANGKPLAGGYVYFYVPGTTTPKTTYQDAGQTTPNSNPVRLDSAGRAIIFGTGNYRQILQDSAGNTIWDQQTSGISNAFFSALNPYVLLGNPTGSSAGVQSIGLQGGLSFVGSNLTLNYPMYSDTGSLTVNSGYQLTSRISNGPMQYTLPATSSLYNGFGFWFSVFGGTLTLQPNAADNFPGAGSGVAVTIPAGFSGFLQTNGSGKWYVQLNYNSPNSAATFAQPQGRLTLASGAPVMTSTVVGASSIIYTPYLGSLITVYSAGTYINQSFSELTQLLSDSTLSPGAATASQNYDIFYWLNGSTPVISRGPAWTSNTARGVGAGTTQLARSIPGGLWVNAFAITNGPAAGAGTYLGTIRTNGSATVDYILGGAAAGGTAASFGVWNYYNRVNTSAIVQDNNPSWTYSVSAWRPSDNSTSMRVSFVTGFAEDSIDSAFYALNSNSGGYGGAGVGIDSTTAPSGLSGVSGTSTNSMIPSRYTTLLLGWHFVQALEVGAGGSGTTTWYGNYTGANGLVVNLKN